MAKNRSPKPYLKWCNKGQHWAVRGRDFGINKRRPDSVQSWCYECWSSYYREKYQGNLEEARRLHNAANLRRRVAMKVAAIAVLLLSGLPSWAAVGFRSKNAGGSSSTSATSATTGSIAVRRGDFIIVIASFGAGGSTVSSVTNVNGDTFTQCSACTSNNTARIEVWTATVSITGGGGGAGASLNMTVNYSAGSKSVLHALSYYGVDSIGTGSSTTSGSANPSVSLTTQDNYGNICLAAFAGPTTTTGSASVGNLRSSSASTAGTPVYLADIDNTVQNAGSCTTSLTNATSTWAIAQLELRSSVWSAPVQLTHNNVCSSGSATCVITLDSALGTGHLLFINVGASTNISISSITDNGSSANTYTIDANSKCTDASAGSASGAYVLSTNSGAATTITITMASAPAANWIAQATEVQYELSPIAFDTSNNKDDTSAATSHSGPTLTLTGSGNEMLFHFARAQAGSVSAVDSSYIPVVINAATTSARKVTNSGTAPSFTTSSTRACMGALAFTEPALSGCHNRLTLLGAGCN